MKDSKQPVSCVRARNSSCRRLASPGLRRSESGARRSEAEAAHLSAYRLRFCKRGRSRPWISRAFSPAGKIGVSWIATRGESTCGHRRRPRHHMSLGESLTTRWPSSSATTTLAAFRRRRVHKRILRHRHRDCRQLREGGTPGLGLLDGRPPDAAHLRQADRARIRAPTEGQFSHFSARTAISL